MAYDVVVIGAGIEGSSTAYHLIKNGVKRVLLLEQFAAGHTRGSSHGGSRITRHAYRQPYYVHMMDEAFKIWSQLEREGNVDLFVRTGVLVFGPERYPSVTSVRDSLHSNNVSCDVYTADEVERKYPRQLSVPSDHIGVFEKDGGILRANRALETFQKLFVAGGGVFLDNHCVSDILPGDQVTVRTNKGDFVSKKVIITAGAWANKLLSKLGVDLPLKVTRAEAFYWKVAKPDDFSPECFPVFLCYPSKDEQFFFYGMPVFEYPGLMKIAQYTGPMIDPDHRDAQPTPWSDKSVSNFVKTYFKGVSTTHSIYEACIFTESPDENPILDKHPVHQNIVIGAGFSGHGFKLSPVIGKILCELAMEQPPSYDLSPFRMDRFSQQLDSKL